MSHPPRRNNDRCQSSARTAKAGRSARARIGIGFALFFLLFALVALSSGGNISRPAEAKRKAIATRSNVNGVQVTPAEITLPARGGVQFTAEITGVADQSVSWSVSGLQGGNTLVGTISGNGFYTAPDLSPDAPPAQFIIRATSLADASMFGEATVTVTGRGSQFRSPSVSVQHGSAPDANTISTFNTDAVSVMFGASPPFDPFATYLSNAISVQYGTPSSSNAFPTFLSNAISVQYGTPSANPFSTYLLNSVSVSYGTPPDICTPPPSGMVAWYPGDGNANDIQGDHNPSDINAVSFVPGGVGQGFTFGAGGYIDIPHANSLATQTLSVDAWVRPDGPGPNNDAVGSAILSKNINTFSSAQSSMYLGWSATDNRFVFYIFANTSVRSSQAYLPGQVYHVTGTYDGSTIRLYVNGELAGERAHTTTIVYDQMVPYAIGSNFSGFRSASFPRTWNGVIDEVGIFNRALSQTEIQAIYNAGRRANVRREI